MYVIIPPHHRPAKGAGFSHVTAELMQIHEYLCTFNISTHLCFFKEVHQCHRWQVGLWMTGGNGERGCLPLPFASPGSYTNTEPPAPAGRMLSNRVKSTRIINSRETWNLCVRAEIMVPVQKFQIPGNLKLCFLQSVFFFFEWCK